MDDDDDDDDGGGPEEDEPGICTSALDTGTCICCSDISGSAVEGEPSDRSAEGSFRTMFPP